METDLATPKEVRPKDAAAMLGLSTSFVHNLISDGTLESRTLLRKGKRRGIRLITLESIQKYLEQK
jgi:DNA-binding Xre family transcriptional regulator